MIIIIIITLIIITVMAMMFVTHSEVMRALTKTRGLYERWGAADENRQEYSCIVVIALVE